MALTSLQGRCMTGSPPPVGPEETMMRLLAKACVMCFSGVDNGPKARRVHPREGGGGTPPLTPLGWTQVIGRAGHFRQNYRCLCIFFFFNVYLFWRGRETETEWERGRGRDKRGGHRILSRLQVLSCQHRARRGARTHKL